MELGTCAQRMCQQSQLKDIKALALVLPAQCRWKHGDVNTSVSGNSPEAAQEWLKLFDKKLVTRTVFYLKWN